MSTLSQFLVAENQNTIKKIQKGVLTISGNTTTVSISALSSISKSFLIFSYHVGNYVGVVDAAQYTVRGVITDSTHLTFTRGEGTSSYSPWIEWQVIEYN